MVVKNREDRVSPSGTSSDSTGLLQLLLAVAVGTVAALIVLPNWLPALAGSLVGTVPNAYWYFVRSSGFVAFGLLWLSMAMGLLITNKIARVWPNGPVAYDLHQFVSVLGLIFGFIHPVLMLGDQYTLAQIFVPFGGIQVRAIPVAMGQITLILMALIVPSFAARWIIGHRTWRLLHYLSFPVFLMALFHGVLTGTDSATPLATGMYWASAASLVILTIYRVQVSRSATRRAALVYAGIGKGRVRETR